MTLPEEIIDLLRQKSGLRLRASGDCKALIDAIYNDCGKILGLSTMKRLLGFFSDSRTPHTSTLDIIALYLGYTDWDALFVEKCNGDSGFDSSLQHLDTSTLDEGAVVRISYPNNRILEIRHFVGTTFELINYNGHKLHPGDKLTILEIVLHFPLFIKDVSRDGKSLGSYIAARRNGVQEIVILPPTSEGTDE